MTRPRSRFPHLGSGLPEEPLRLLARSLAAVFLALLLLGLASLASRFLFGYRSALEGLTAFGQPDTLSSWYLTLLWAAAAVFSAYQANRAGPQDRWYWLAISLLGLAASQGASIGLIGRLILPIRFQWSVVYHLSWVPLVGLLVLWAVLRPFLTRQRRATRSRFDLALGLYCLAVLIVIGGSAVDWLPTRLVAYSLTSAAEAGLRMAAASIVVYALVAEACTQEESSAVSSAPQE